MQSSFRILPEGDGYVLAMARELIEPQLADLKKYAVFSKSKLTDESDSWVRFGLDGADATLVALGLDLAEETGAVARAAGVIAVRVSPGRVELWAAAQLSAELHSRLRAQVGEAPVNDWLLGQVRAGIAQVMPQTREAFIPQMLNLQAIGGVSFKKGCYTGQEIVARMQYLGKLKQRLYRLQLDGNDLPEPGTPLFSPVHASAVGDVALAARGEHGVEVLAVLRNDAAEQGELHLGSAEGVRLALLELPYTLDRDREIQR